MGIQNISLDILVDWMNADVPNQGIIVGAPNFVNLAILNDVDKIANLQNYLNARILKDQSAIAALPQYVTDQTNLLNADISACQQALAEIIP